MGLQGVYISGPLAPGDACASRFPYTASICSQVPYGSLRWTLGTFTREAANSGLHSMKEKRKVLEERLQLLHTQQCPVSPSGQVSLQKSGALGDVLGQTKHIFWTLAAWMFQVLQGNGHQSPRDFCGFTLGARHWAYSDTLVCVLCRVAPDAEVQCILRSLELRCMNGLSCFYYVGSGCIPPCHLWDAYSACPQTCVGFWFTTLDPLCCLMCTLYTCGSYFSDCHGKQSLLPSPQINMQVITQLKCLEGNLHQERSVKIGQNPRLVAALPSPNDTCDPAECWGVHLYITATY